MHIDQSKDSTSVTVALEAVYCLVDTSQVALLSTWLDHCFRLFPTSNVAKSATAVEPNLRPVLPLSFDILYVGTDIVQSPSATMGGSNSVKYNHFDLSLQMLGGICGRHSLACCISTELSGPTLLVARFCGRGAFVSSAVRSCYGSVSKTGASSERVFSKALTQPLSPSLLLLPSPAFSVACSSGSANVTNLTLAAYGSLPAAWLVGQDLQCVQDAGAPDISCAAHQLSGDTRWGSGPGQTAASLLNADLNKAGAKRLDASVTLERLTLDLVGGAATLSAHLYIALTSSALAPQMEVHFLEPGLNIAGNTDVEASRGGRRLAFNVHTCCLQVAHTDLTTVRCLMHQLNRLLFFLAPTPPPMSSSLLVFTSSRR